MNLMKKLSVLIIVVLLLSACGSKTTEIDGEENIEGQAGNSEADRERLSMDFTDDALSPALQLVVGTLILEDTDLAVDAELAETLVPYWKLYITLTESDTTAPEELDAIINEIQLLMTPDQVNYIAGLELIQEDMMTMIDELGIFEDLRADGSGDGSGATRPEGLPEGTRPGGGQGGGRGVEGMDPELVATMQAQREEDGGGSFRNNRFIIPLVDELISLLEEKAGN